MIWNDLFNIIVLVFPNWKVRFSNCLFSSGYLNGNLFPTGAAARSTSRSTVAYPVYCDRCWSYRSPECIRAREERRRVVRCVLVPTTDWRRSRRAPGSPSSRSASWKSRWARSEWWWGGTTIGAASCLRWNWSHRAASPTSTRPVRPSATSTWSWSCTGNDRAASTRTTRSPNRPRISLSPSKCFNQISKPKKMEFKESQKSERFK